MRLCVSAPQRAKEVKPQQCCGSVWDEAQRLDEQRKVGECDLHHSWVGPATYTEVANLASFIAYKIANLAFTWLVE